MAATLLLLLLVFSVGGTNAENGMVVEVTRNRDGDEYFAHNGTSGNCEKRTCPRSNPTLGSGGACQSDISLRNQYCPSNEGQYLLSPGRNNLEIFAVISNNGTLKVFDNESSNYENGYIANKNIYNHMFEKQHERIGCNITGMAVMRSLTQTISVNQSGFNVLLEEDGDIFIEVEEENLAYPREDYDGEIFRMNIGCMENSNLDCIVFKLNGTANFCEEKFGFHPTANNKCQQLNSSHTSFSTPIGVSSTSSTLTTEASTRITSFWEDPVIQNIMIGSGCGIVVLACIISILCVGICTLSVKSKNTAAIYARRMEIRYNAAQDEDHYFINRSHTSIARNDESTGASTGASTAGNAETQLTEEGQVQLDDHTYASVDDAQAEVDEVRQKETTAKKFGYASITFDTFKPSERQAPTYQPEPDEEHSRNRLPSFARNYNPAANRIHLARSYEVVTLMHKPANEANNRNVNQPPQEDGPIDEYDTLNHRERKLTTMSQRNFSISQAEYATDYSQLSQVQKQHKQKMPLFDEATNHSTNEKPIPKTRTRFPNPMPLSSSYTCVKKNAPPPLPPPYNPRFDGQAIEEDHYKVPRKQKRPLSGHYDQPSSLIRIAWSCEDFTQASPHQAQGHQAAARSIYDMPSSISPPMARKFEKKVPEMSLHSLISQDSYVDMSATQV